jgi:hypothetical protein
VVIPAEIVEIRGENAFIIIGKPVDCYQYDNNCVSEELCTRLQEEESPEYVDI